MNKIKIHKALVAGLVTCSLIITSLAIQQAIASTSYSGTVTTHSLVSLVDTPTYSDEVELTSAPEFSKTIMQLRDKYRDALVLKLGNRLKNINSEKLTKIVDKIEEMIEITKVNDRLSLIKKEKIIAQLLALKDIIKDQVDTQGEYSIDINLEYLLRS